MAVTLEQLRTRKHSVAPAELRSLTADEMAILRAHAEAELPGLPRARAIWLLQHADPDGAAALLRRILRDPSESDALKARAADFASRLGEDELLADELAALAVTARQPAARARLARVLGRIGGPPSAQDALDQLCDDRVASVRRVAVRARRFWRVRHGESEGEPLDFEREPRGSGTTLDIRPPPADVVARVLEHSEHFVWGARFGAPGAASWTCEQRTSVAVVNLDFDPGRGGVLALIAGIEVGEGFWDVDWVVTAHGRRDGWAVIGWEAESEPAWAGLVGRLDDPVVVRTLADRFPLVRAVIRIGAAPAVQSISRWDAPFVRKRAPRPDPE